MNNYGFIRVAAASPKLKVANPYYNVKQIEELMKAAEEESCSVVVFPELCVTGYTCADLFESRMLLEASNKAISELLEATKDSKIAALIGMPLAMQGRVYNCACMVQSGKVMGIVPKTYIPNYKEFYEKRWFTSGAQKSLETDEIDFLGNKVPFGNLLFKDVQSGAICGVEICEDLWAPIPPSSYMAVAGANIILNPSASNELVSKVAYKNSLIAQQSARCACAYVYSSSGVHESTTDLVFGGECVVAENGTILKVSERFQRENSVIYMDIDLERMETEREINKSFADCADFTNAAVDYRVVEFDDLELVDFSKDKLQREVSSTPFIPNNPRTIDERCSEIFSIQVAGLAKRLEHTGMKKAVIGISGGLDSTLAVLVASKTFELLGIDSKNISCITMPGFGTTSHTLESATQLMKSLNTDIRSIDIKAACLQHFKDIGHDPAILNVTYENVQARERTKILMDIANKEGGLVVGTGDLSELALGWCTYNGDHMSMYAVNTGVPKTLVKFLVKWVADNSADEDTRNVLYRILDTPISPELLPPDKEGKINQKTEDTVGPYILHDFYLYYFVRFGMKPSKLFFLAKNAFGDTYSDEILKKWLRVFIRRFFTQQFKRSCIPDGPKVGSVSLSPRGDWRMPSDGDMEVWLKDIDNI